MVLAGARDAESLVSPRKRADGVVGILTLSALVGLSSFLSGWLFVEAYAPGATRGHKRQLVEHFLPAAILLFTAISIFALSLGARRADGFQALLRRGRPATAAQATRMVLLALAVGLSTPLLQALLGVGADTSWSPLVGGVPRLALTALALLAAALQEEVLVRVLVIETVRAVVKPCVGSQRRDAALTIGAVLSVVVAFAFHSTGSTGEIPLRAGLVLGLSKVPAMVVFTLVYLRIGLVDAVLVHGGANLVVLALVPALTAHGS